MKTAEIKMYMLIIIFTLWILFASWLILYPHTTKMHVQCYDGISNIIYEHDIVKTSNTGTEHYTELDTGNLVLIDENTCLFTKIE